MAFPDDNEADPFKQGRSATNDILSGYSSRSELLNSQSEMQRNDAMELLQRALNNAPQVSAEQGIAAALLAAIPTLGGALIGRSVGHTKLPAGAYGVKGLQPTGMSAGGMAGAEIGNEAAQGFLKRLDRTKETTPILKDMADLKSQQAQQTAQQANQVENARLAAQTNIDMMPLEEAKQIRIAQAAAGASYGNQLSLEKWKMENDPKKAVYGELEDPAKKAAFDKITSGQGTPADMAVLSPKAIELANQGLRSQAYSTSVGNTQQRFETQQGYSQGFNTSVIAPIGNDPKLNAKRAEIIGARTMAKAAADQLAQSYDRTSGQFIGIDRATESALASSLYTAARGLAGTGAQLTANEQPLVQALSAPQLDINGAVDYVHRLLTSGGDPAQITRSISSVLDKSFEAKLNGYGQSFFAQNPQGQPWAQPAAGATPAATPTAGGLPQVGGMFEGKKVLSVKKVS